jgi:hypothetical protein
MQIADLLKSIENFRRELAIEIKIQPSKPCIEPVLDSYKEFLSSFVELKGNRFDCSSEWHLSQEKIQQILQSLEKIFAIHRGLYAILWNYEDYKEFLRNEMKNIQSVSDGEIRLKIPDELSPSPDTRSESKISLSNNRHSFKYNVDWSKVNESTFFSNFQNKLSFLLTEMKWRILITNANSNQKTFELHFCDNVLHAQAFETVFGRMAALRLEFVNDSSTDSKGVYKVSFRENTLLGSIDNFYRNMDTFKTQLLTAYELFLQNSSRSFQDKTSLEALVVPGMC